MNRKHPSHFHKEVTTKLRTLPKANPKDAAFAARYVGSVGHEKRTQDEQSKLFYLGHRIPDLRALSKTGFSFSTLPRPEQINIWTHIWETSNTFEELTLALGFFEDKKMRHTLPELWPVLKEFVKRIDNWAHSDQLSGLYAEILESDHKRFLPFFKEWNSSENPWERRQSLVGLLYYQRFRKKTLPAKIYLKMVENLIDDPHFFVQKAVGWTLREIYQIDEKAQVEFVKKHIARIPSAGLFATVERYPAKLKLEMKKLRSKARAARKK